MYSCILVNHIIGIRSKKTNKTKQYLRIHIGGSFFNKKKATTILGANAHKKLKLFGAVEWLVKNHKKTINKPKIPVVKNNVKSSHLLLFEFFMFL